MTNLYSCTNLDGWTAGTQNRELEHFKRTPQYFEYAISADEAISQVKNRFFTQDKSTLNFDAILLKTDVVSPVKAQLIAAKAAGGAL